MASHFSAIFIGRQIDARPLVLMLDYEHEGRRQWKAPVGVSDPGESPEQTGVREVREETGLVVPPDALTQLLVRPTSHDHSQYFFASTEFSLSQDDPREAIGVDAGEGCSAAAWFIRSSFRRATVQIARGQGPGEDDAGSSRRHRGPGRSSRVCRPVLCAYRAPTTSPARQYINYCKIITCGIARPCVY